jgi:hypothetical protein
MTSPERLPVYVIHYHAPEWCRATIESLRAGELPVCVHVVDNGGLGPLEGTQVLTQRENRGFTAGANAALAHWLGETDSEFCAITSHDLDLDPSCLLRLVTFAQENPTTGVLGPRLTGTGRGKLSLYAKAFDRAGAQAVAPGTRKPLPGALRSAWVSGSCLVLRRACVEQVGPFDERFGSYCEDVDYGVRANLQGWDVVVVEDAMGTTEGSAHAVARTLMWSNMVLTGAKHLGPRAVVHRLALSARRVVRAVLVTVRHPSRAREMSVVGRRSAAAIVKGTALSVSWYAHVARRRMKGRPPVQGRCADPALLRVLATARPNDG